MILINLEPNMELSLTSFNQPFLWIFLLSGKNKFSSINDAQ